MRRIELTFDPTLKIKVKLEYTDEEITLSIGEQIKNINDQFINIGKFEEVIPSEQLYSMEEPPAHYITFNVDKLDEFLILIKRLVKEKLISLVAVLDVETNDLLFLNEDPIVKKLADHIRSL